MNIKCTDIKTKLMVIITTLLILVTVLNAEEKKLPVKLDFSAGHLFTYGTVGNQTNEMYSAIEMAFNLSVPVSFYKFSLFANDYFESDFNVLNDSLNDGVTDPALIVQKILFNRMTFGIGNRFRIGRAVDISADFSTDINILFTGNTSFSFYPSLGLKGDYVSGFYWSIQGVFTGYLSLNPELYQFNPEGVLNAGYEFFRTYGPVNFKFGLDSVNTIAYSIDTKLISSTMKHGLYILYKGLYAYTGFVNTIDYYQTTGILYSETGVNISIDYFYKFITVYTEYTGVLTSNELWKNTITAGFKFSVGR